MMKRIRAWTALALLAVTSTLLVACAAAGPQTIAIVFETWDVKYGPAPGRVIAINAMALNKYGAPGEWVDDAGIVNLYPMNVGVASPWTFRLLPVLPGESAAVDVSGTIFGTVGEYITCAVFVDGEQVGDRDEKRIQPYHNLPFDSPINQSGTATARCLYTLNVPAA